MLAPFTTRVKSNVDDVLQMTQMINGIMMTGDSRANQIIVELYGNNGRIRLDPTPYQQGTSKVVAYFIRGDGYTVEVEGDINTDGDPFVIIPRAAYEVTGALSIAIRLLDDRQEETIEGETVISWGTKIVIAALSCFVQNTETDAIVDPDHKIPDVQELLAYIDILDEQYEDIADAESARVLAEQGRVTAEQTRASTYAQRDSEMQAAITKIDDMTVSASALPYSSQPTVQISEVSGHKHIAFGLVSGEPFAIKRTFASIAEMEAYSGTDVHVGDMVIIVSTVEDPDNAKLYVKTENSWAFIIDMSGATGIQGPKGDTGNGIASAVLNNDYTLTLTFTNGTTYTTGSIRGEKGDKGDNSSYDHASIEYGTSASTQIIPVSWSSSIPTVSQGEYLWTKMTVYFNPSGSFSFYSVARQGMDGSGGTVTSVNNVYPDSNGNVTLVQVSGTRLIIG